MTAPDPAEAAFSAWFDAKYGEGLPLDDTEFDSGEMYEAFAAGYAQAAAAERERLLPLARAMYRLYQVVWHETGTVEIDVPGYNGLSYDDTNAVDVAASAVEALVANDRAIADLLRQDGDTR